MTARKRVPPTCGNCMPRGNLLKIPEARAEKNKDEGDDASMKIQPMPGRRLRFAAAAACLAGALILAGCAGGSSARTTAADGPSVASPDAGPEAEARCRQAIADVTKLCADDGEASRCRDAKARSRAACI